jgi:hypothetical protein
MTGWLWMGVLAAGLTAGRGGPGDEETPPASRPTTLPARTLTATETVLPGQIGTTVVMSPDGRHVACSYQRGDKWLLMVDGQAGREEYDGVARGSVVFSPDSTRVACFVRVGDEWALMADGRRGALYEQMMSGPPVFSPDSKRLAFCGKRAGKWTLVVDDRERPEHEEFDDFAPGSLTFSADSSRAACAMWRQGRLLVLTEEWVGPGHDQVAAGPPSLSRDGRHVAYWAMRAKKWVLAVDGIEGRDEYDGYLNGSRPIFLTPDRVQAVGTRGEQTFLIDADVPNR